MANLSINIPGLNAPIVTTVGAAASTSKTVGASSSATPSASPTMPAMSPDPLPTDLQQSTDIDIGEAAVPTEIEPLPAGTKPGNATDVYVAPMSNAKQRFWQKLMCIGCCVPDN